MIDTQLILIEGLPGSGKSTTAENLASEIKNHGKRCHCFLEWAENHPIFIGYHEDMAEIISSSPLREPALVEKWEAFSKGVPWVFLHNPSKRYIPGIIPLMSGGPGVDSVGQ